MPFNGAGLFVRLRSWVADAAAGIRIRADYHDIEDDGFADGLSNCIARDGQSTVTNNIPMNSKRLVALANPVDPQDAATKAYADTKLPLAGGTISGNLGVTGSISASGTVTAIGYQTRAGLAGPNVAGTWFNLNWIEGSGAELWANTFNWGLLATQTFASTVASNAAAPKVNRAGDTMTGGLTVNGNLFAIGNTAIFLGGSGNGYLQWNGGGTYTLGSGGIAYHTGNLRPILDGRLTMAGDYTPGNGSMNEPLSGAVVTGLSGAVIVVPSPGTGGLCVTAGRFRYLQLQVPAGWYTVAYA